jgi:hypothetical protein
LNGRSRKDQVVAHLGEVLGVLAYMLMEEEISEAQFDVAVAMIGDLLENVL